jgi:NDP-sugar pyrophosphorylase family protein
MDRNLIILCGGLGTRLGDLTQNIPKSMMLINGKPFLEIIFKQFINLNFSKFILATGHLHDYIFSYFGDEYNEIPIIYSKEEQKLGTGGAIKNAFEANLIEHSFVINGDTYIDIDEKIISELETNKPSILVKKIKNIDRYGSLILNKDKFVKNFLSASKVLNKESLINLGVYFLDKRFFSMTEEKAFSLESDYLPQYIQKKDIKAIITDSFFIDIGIPKDLLTFTTMMRNL